jgi:type IV pilus assembly protein PilV
MKQNGFTLIEVLISIAVFSIGILGVATMNIYAINGNAASFDMTRAVYMASAKVESLSAKDIDSSYLAAGDYEESGIDNLYDINWNITNLSSFSKKIDIKVSWKKRGKNKELSVSYIKRD